MVLMLTNVTYTKLTAFLSLSNQHSWLTTAGDLHY